MNNDSTSYRAGPDRFERVVRIVCGALFGLLPAFMVWTSSDPFSPIATGLMTVFFMVVCALLALRYGDSFWQAALSLFRGF
jgi:uncharacterized membrane protein YgaE (UPF0421/DUF939 family)